MGTGISHEPPGSETKSSLSQLRTGVSVPVPQVSVPTVQSKEDQPHDIEHTEDHVIGERGWI